MLCVRLFLFVLLLLKPFLSHLFDLLEALVAVILQLLVQWQWISVFKRLIHLNDGFLVEFFKLRVEQVDDLLDGLVLAAELKRLHQMVSWLSAQFCVALRALLSVRVLHEVLEDAGLAKSVEALVDCCRISEEPCADLAL